MDSISKFYGKSDAYEKGRPSYPKALIEYLYKSHGFSPDSVIADIGSGTGKFTKLLLEMGSTVIGIEPNDDMRKKAEEKLSEFKNFKSVCGYADSTGLPNLSVDFITAAQSFHWFDAEKFKAECRRILKPNGKIALIWNMRSMDDSLNRDWHSVFKEFCPEFHGFSNGISENDDKIRLFFDSFEKTEFQSPIPMDKTAFLQRSLSSSYSLTEKDDNFKEYTDELNRIFNLYCDNTGTVSIKNKTTLYVGSIK